MPVDHYRGNFGSPVFQRVTLKYREIKSDVSVHERAWKAHDKARFPDVPKCSNFFDWPIFSQKKASVSHSFINTKDKKYFRDSRIEIWNKMFLFVIRKIPLATWRTRQILLNTDKKNPSDLMRCFVWTVIKINNAVKHSIFVKKKNTCTRLILKFGTLLKPGVYQMTCFLSNVNYEE